MYYVCTVSGDKQHVLKVEYYVVLYSFGRSLLLLLPVTAFIFICLLLQFSLPLHGQINNFICVFKILFCFSHPCMGLSSFSACSFLSHRDD